ncbi:hypothetical protein DFH06DRAFT_1138507 [Mycena polygramma]|nr:hypothetical protein DFH06DRAFT_1138507 [Mycena polygramma]
MFLAVSMHTVFIVHLRSQPATAPATRASGPSGHGRCSLPELSCQRRRGPKALGASPVILAASGPDRSYPSNSTSYTYVVCTPRVDSGRRRPQKTQKSVGTFRIKLKHTVSSSPISQALAAIPAQCPPPLSLTFLASISLYHALTVARHRCRHPAIAAPRCCDWPHLAIMLSTVSAGTRPQRAAQRYRINPVARARARETHVRGMHVGRRWGRHGADFTPISCCSLLPASLRTMTAVVVRVPVCRPDLVLTFEAESADGLKTVLLGLLGPPTTGIDSGGAYYIEKYNISARGIGTYAWEYGYILRTD